MTGDPCRSGPPWRRHDRSWPPHPFEASSARARTRFFRGLLVGALALVALATVGVAALGWLLVEQAGLRRSIGVSVSALTALAVSFLLVAAMTIRRGAGPLRAVMDAADRVAGGDYRVRVREAGPPPVRALAHAFNAMTAKLAEADRQRRDLMADVAHELRTPLSVLQGRLEGLLDGVYPRDDRQLAALLEQTQVLSRLIEDLRTLALADAGALRLEREPVDVVALVHETVAAFEPEASRHGVTIDVAATMAEADLDVDAVRIRQVLANLLANAIRHTPAGGGVAVSVDAVDAGVAVAVADAGTGMAPDELARAFDRFYKGDGSRGSGLGLTIARQLVAAHGGAITAASRPGEGTTVTFVLPAKGAQEGPP